VTAARCKFFRCILFSRVTGNYGISSSVVCRVSVTPGVEKYIYRVDLTHPGSYTVSYCVSLVCWRCTLPYANILYVV